MSLRKSSSGCGCAERRKVLKQFVKTVFNNDKPDQPREGDEIRPSYLARMNARFGKRTQ